MTLRHLKIFVTVCKYGSMTKAAEDLHIAQPSVTLAVKELENYYGVILFNRINQRLVLTDFGKEALLRARETLAAFSAFEDLMNRSERNVTLNIGASLTVGKFLIPRFWHRIETEYPEVRCFVAIYQTHIIEQKIKAGELDFAIVEEQVTSPYLHAIPYTKDTLVAVAGIDYPVSPALSLADLTSHRLLLREVGSSSRDLLELLFAANGITAHPAMESASIQALIASVEEGLGMGILPRALVEDKIGRTLRQVEITGISLERNSYIIYHKNKKFSPTQKKILDLCLSMKDEAIR